jgi:hypothetical protein
VDGHRGAVSGGVVVLHRRLGGARPAVPRPARNKTFSSGSAAAAAMVDGDLAVGSVRVLEEAAA